MARLAIETLSCRPVALGRASGPYMRARFGELCTDSDLAVSVDAVR